MSAKIVAACVFGVAFTACQNPDSTASKSSIRAEDQPTAAVRAAEDEDEDYEELLAVEEIPENVREAALDEVPGLVIEEAEKEMEGGELHYCVHGTANGVFYEVEVSPEGEVLEVESGDEDDEDED